MSHADWLHRRRRAARRHCDWTRLPRAMLAMAQRANPAVTFREGDAEGAVVRSRVVRRRGDELRPAASGASRSGHRRSAAVIAPGGRYGFTIWASPEEAVGFGMVLKAVETFGRTGRGAAGGAAVLSFQQCRWRSARDERRQGFADIHVHRSPPLTWAMRLLAADAAFGGRDAQAFELRRSSARRRRKRSRRRTRLAVRQSVEALRQGNVPELPMPAVLASASDVTVV